MQEMLNIVTCSDLKVSNMGKTWLGSKVLLSTKQKETEITLLPPCNSFFYNTHGVCVCVRE